MNRSSLYAIFATAAAIACTSPAWASLSPAAAYHSIGDGFGSGNVGQATGFYSAGSGTAYASVNTRISPLASIEAYAINSNTVDCCGAAFVSATIDYSFDASFTAEAGLNFTGRTYGGPKVIRIQGVATGWSFGDAGFSIDENDALGPILSGGGTNYFTIIPTLTQTSSLLGGGLALYTLSGLISFDVELQANAFPGGGAPPEDPAQVPPPPPPNRAYAYFDPAISFNPAFIAAYNPGGQLIQLSPGVSNASGPLPGVPEPTTWALLVGGFGLTGALTRRRRTRSVAA